MVSVVLAAHTHVSDRAFRVLVRMAAQALDSENARGQQPGLYFGGWEPLALTLGRDVPDAEAARQDPAARKARDRVSETVRRALAELEKAGIVERVGRAHTGSRQTYRLHLSPTATVPLSRQESPTATVPLSPTAAVPLSGEEPHRQGGESPTATVPPRKKKEPEGEDLLQDRNLNESAHLTGRAGEKTEHQAVHIAASVSAHPFRVTVGGLCSDCRQPRFAHAGWGTTGERAV